MRHLTRPLNKILLALAGASLAGIALAKGNELSSGGAGVGEINFVLGKAVITQANGSKIPAAIGVQIHVGDAIDTAANGHVQIRFIDNELVKVRPSSTMEVVRYDYNPQKPQDSAIKFNLVEGTSRAISGEGATRARQNFRMNTPIAAIGVRGTDFIVNADHRSVRALVKEGAIVVAPISGQCSAEALGPCAGQELTGLSRQILQLTSTTTGIASALLPATNAQAQALVAEASAKADNNPKSQAKPAEAKELYAETVTSLAVNATLASNTKATEILPPPPPPPPEFTPALVQTAEALTTNTQLVWGRWSSSNLDNERITVEYGVARAGDRQVTVGDLSYALFRSEPTGSVMQPGLGTLSFNLTKAQAMYNSGGQSDLMQVSGGQLSLDFKEAKFSTSLHLNSAKTGNVTFSDQGIIFPGGYFNSRSDNQLTSGAVSVDGKEAGYLFQKILTGGTIEGLTLWGKNP